MYGLYAGIGGRDQTFGEIKNKLKGKQFGHT